MLEALRGIGAISEETLFYLASLSLVKRVAPEICASILAELRDQRGNLKLIASENYCSIEVQAAMGNLLTDKYAEGYPYQRFYAGCENVDAIEDLACREACALFGSDHAYVQPHSGADANLVAFWAILRTRIQEPRLARLGKESPLHLSPGEWTELRKELGNQRMFAMDLFAGGHLTHGYKFNMSAQLFDVYQYGVDTHSGLLDYDALARQLREVRPLIFLVGYSAYPRHIDFKRMREMADEVGAVLMVDMAHFAGLVAGKVFNGVHNPVPYAHVLTSTTHKTLRGPRGGIVLCTKEFAESVDKGCPMVLGGPLPHVMAAKAVALREASSPQFQDYAARVVGNARALAESCVAAGLHVVTGGTDNHLLLIDVQPLGLTGRQAESALRASRITLNRNTIPNDPNGPWYTSGLRIGTAAATTLGMNTHQMEEIANFVVQVLHATKPVGSSKAKYEVVEHTAERVRNQVSDLLSEFPLYPKVDFRLIQELLVGEIA